MKKTSILWLAALFLVSGYEASANPKTPGDDDYEHINIGKTTKHCEIVVSKFCASSKGTCSRYCVTANKGKAEKQASCKTHCKVDAYCSTTKPSKEKTIEPLVKQNKEQVIACIAQLRDPSGENSGRRMEDWKVIQTPSFTKIVGEPVAEEDAPAAEEVEAQ